MKRMLFNATHAEELRVAIVDGQKLLDLDIESASKEQRKSNIYKAIITRIEPSLEAAFVDYGAERHGFLPFKEISRSYFQPGVDANRASIKEALREGQELIVQVDKDERGNKGAAMTTFISLAGRYLVLMPNNPRGGGVSRRVEGDERAELRDALDQLEVPQGMSLIARTAAIGRGTEELQWDMNYLLQLWKAIEEAASANVIKEFGTRLLYPEGDLVTRAIRDYFQPDIGELLVDTDDIFDKARYFMSTVMPTNVSRVKRYNDDVPLFSRFQIEHQIESAYSRQVTLPSGGAIVIDHTEALVAIDVNSSRSTRGADIEDTAFRTNLEAAEEITRQLRLRDLGGLIIIDFIDMESLRNQREVENCLREGLKLDRARVQTGKISRFGLMELSRQRLRPALAETSYIPCPRCSGTGHIRSAESAALHILRILEEEAMKDNTAALHAQVPVEVATFLLNEKRADVHAVELRHKVTILLIPNIHLETPQHNIVRLRHDELNQEEIPQPSYRMVEMPTEESEPTSGKTEVRPPRQEAAVKRLIQPPAPIVEKPAEEKGGFLARVLSWFRGEDEGESKPAPEASPERKPRASVNLRENRRDTRHMRHKSNENESHEGREGREARLPREAKGARNEAQKPQPRRRNEPRPPERRENKENRDNKEARESKEAPIPTVAPVVPVVAVAPVVSVAEPMEFVVENAPKTENSGFRRRGRRNAQRERSERTERTNTPEPVAATQETEEPLFIRLGEPGKRTGSKNKRPDDNPTSGELQLEIPLAPLTVSVESAAPVMSPRDEEDAPLVSLPAPPEETMPLRVTLPQAEETIPPTSAAEMSVETDEISAPLLRSEPAPQPPPAREAIDIGQALETNGLVMIETRSDKEQTWQAPVLEENAVPPRRRRAASGTVPEEPLVMVETRSSPLE